MTEPARDGLWGQRVAFTGRLASLTPAEPAELVAAYGGLFVPPDLDPGCWPRRLAAPQGRASHAQTPENTSIRTIVAHQLLSELHFFAQFVGTQEAPVEVLIPPADKPTTVAYIDKYVWPAKLRLPQ